MKTCPNCKVQVGGADYCPLCQSELVGEPTPPVFPKVVPEHRRYSLFYKILAFCLLAGTIICVAVDLLETTPHLHWSLPVLLCVVAFLVLLRVLMRPRPNVPRLLFQLLVGVSLVVLFCDWYVGFPGFSLDFVVPILCTATLVLNFVLAFVNKHYTENGLVYLLMNILIGVVPYLTLLFKLHTLPLAWVICLLVSIITFLGLVVFKGKSLWVEIQKRLHM